MPSPKPNGPTMPLNAATLKQLRNRLHDPVAQLVVRAFDYGVVRHAFDTQDGKNRKLPPRQDLFQTMAYAEEMLSQAAAKCRASNFNTCLILKEVNMCAKLFYREDPEHGDPVDLAAKGVKIKTGDEDIHKRPASRKPIRVDGSGTAN